MGGLEKEATRLTYLGSPEFNVLGAGGKAVSLHQLRTAGFPVPPGFVVPHEAELDQIENELNSAVAALGGYPLAVRSSAHLEDLDAASFAGQYATHLKVASLSGLIESIADCRASARTAQALSYLNKNGLGSSRAWVSVLVQKLVDASLAGVAFSIHPHTGREEHALVECCQGLGQTLVSGNTTPTQYVVRLEDGCVVERKPGAEDVYLRSEILSKLCRYALEVQAHFGVPQDIEWALDSGGELWILQSRPITRIRWRGEADEFTNANFRDGGVAASVITPLYYSVYGAALQEALQQYFMAIRTVAKNAPRQAWISKFYGRPYWNASAVKRGFCKVPGFDEQRFDRDLGIQKDYGEAGPVRTPMTPRTLLAAAPVAIALGREFRRQLRLAENYGQKFLPQEAKYLGLAESSDRMQNNEFFTLLLELLRFHMRTESDYLRTVLNHINYQAEFSKLLAHIQAATGEPMALVVLMSGLRDISHMKIQRDFVKLVSTGKNHGIGSIEWNGALAEFLKANHFHGDAQLDISTPRWRERPERIGQMVENILRSGIEPKDAEATAREQFQLYSEEVRRVKAVLHRSLWHRLRFKRVFRKRLDTARVYACRREELREYSMRADNLVRIYALEAGRRLHGQGWLRQEEDVFMLSTEELEAIAGQSESKARILALTEFRRLMHRGYRRLQPPGELGKAILHSTPADQPTASSSDRRLKGNGCSDGKVRGRARVVSNREECNSLKPGEILVTRFTDPSWTPVMGLVAGLVTEVGGLISHGAVIAREYGLPAVLDVRGAIEIIKTGQVVEVDGANGTVSILRAECTRGGHES